jgi:DNA-binding CsgD family transcriptional regulator
VLGGLYLDLLLLLPAIKHLEDALSVASELGSLYRIRSVTGILASAYVADNQLARAESVLDAVVGPETPAETLGQRPCWYARAELLLVRGEPDHALAIADRLIAATRNVGQAGLTALPHLALLRGDALAALERPTDAESSFRAAITGAIHQGARPLLWRVHLALGCLYHGQQRSADAERELDDAWGVIEELAATIAEPALREAFLQQAVVRFPEPYSRSMHRPVGQATAGLSAREREVAALIAEGRTNGEIAEALFVSKRTVETHVGSILSKLGFTTRAQIIAWVLANGAAISGDQPTG